MVREVALREGGIAAFYRGLTPNLIGNSSSWSVYFLCYGNIKEGIRRLNSGDQELTWWNYFAASGVAGSFTIYRSSTISSWSVLAND